MSHPVARLTAGFIERVANTGITDAAAAAAIGVSKQYYSQVKAGQEAPSVRFLAGAVLAGFADSFADVAEVVRLEAADAA